MGPLGIEAEEHGAGGRVEKVEHGRYVPKLISLGKPGVERAAWGMFFCWHKLPDRYSGRMKSVMLLFLLPLLCLGQDIRGKVKEAGEKKVDSRIIDPNDSIFGYKIGISEDELLAEKGKAMGYSRIDAITSLIYFDTETAYIFTNEKLSGVTVGMNLIDSSIVRYFTKESGYRMSQWKLDNGIRANMSLEEVKKILGDRLKKRGPHPSEYQQYYLDGDSEVHLSLSSSTFNGGEQSFSVHAVMVVPK